MHGVATSRVTFGIIAAMLAVPPTIGVYLAVLRVMGRTAQTEATVAAAATGATIILFLLLLTRTGSPELTAEGYD